MAKERVTIQFPGGEWSPGFLEYAFRYFRSFGTKVESVSDKFIVDHSDERGMSPEEFLKILVDSKIDSAKTKVSTNNDVNPKVSVIILFPL